jgi:hypothetical protein
MGSTNSLNSLLELRARPGIMGAYALKPTKDESPYLKPITMAFENSLVSKQKLQTNIIIRLCKSPTDNNPTRSKATTTLTAH